MLPNPDTSVTAIAKLLGVSPGTLYNHIPDLRELRAAGRAADRGGDPETCPGPARQAGKRIPSPA